METSIKGLTLIPNFIDDEEEEYLINIINDQKWNTSLKRFTQHYGYRYNYTSRSITDEDYLDVLPNWLDLYIDKSLQYNYINEKPDQVIINRYLPGEGISPHVDVPHLFKNQIYSISLGSACNMIFKNKIRQEEYFFYLQPRTLLIMKDDARYNYTHAIKPVLYDIINGKKIKRGTRYSITFRNVIL